jgi:hypothetical protein
MVKEDIERKLVSLMCLFVVLLISEGCESADFRGLPACLESPGRLDASDLPQAFSPFENLCNDDSKVLTCIPPLKGRKDTERVGHVLGAYQEYTMKLTKDGPLPRRNAYQSRDAIYLMETAFNKWYLDAVEFDVHIDYENKDEERVFILHYEPPWAELSSWPDSHLSRQFLDNQRNTLWKLLEVFFNNHAYKGKRLYVELKASKTCQDNGERPTDNCRIVAKRIAAVLKHWSEDIKKNCCPVAFVSFSTQMLEAMHDALSDELLHESVDFILILGPSSQIKAKIASLFKGWVPKFDKNVNDWLVQKDWLVGVWYSPGAIKDLPIKICNINKQREGKFWRRLFVGISVYQQKQEDFMEIVRNSWKQAKAKAPTCGSGESIEPAVVKSFIFDIDRQ